MRKDYIIKDARRILAEQIRDNGRNTMNENPITNATGLSAVIPKDNDGYCTVYKLDCAGFSLFTMISRQRAVIGTDILARTSWRSIIAGRDGKGAYCKAAPACISEKAISPFIQWITVRLKCLSR